MNGGGRRRAVSGESCGNEGAVESVLDQLASKGRSEMRVLHLHVEGGPVTRPMPVERFSRRCPPTSWLISDRKSVV